VSAAYGINVQSNTGPRLRMDTRIAFADDFCSDVNDPSTCNVIGAFRFNSPRADTLQFANPGEKVLVRYILTNIGSDVLERATITDAVRGTIADDASANLASFDSLVVNRIYDAPGTLGANASGVTGTGVNSAGMETLGSTFYGIRIQKPVASVEARIAFARDFCSDVTDASTCNVIGDSRFGQPRSDTLEFVSPGDEVLVRYIVRNAGSTNFERVTINDAVRGLVADETGQIEPFDSLVVNRIYDAPSTIGNNVSRMTATAEDAAGNASNTGGQDYGIRIEAPEIQFETRIDFARNFCSDVTDVSTCGVIGDSRSGQPRPDTLENVTPGEKVLVRYVATNRAVPDIGRFQLEDGLFGLSIDTLLTVETFDSLTVNRIYDAPSSIGINVGDATVIAEDTGGNPTGTKRDDYGIRIAAPVPGLVTRVAKARDFCTDVDDVSTCNVIGESISSFQGRERRPDTVTTSVDRKVLVRYVVRNDGASDLAQVRVDDAVRGLVTDSLIRLQPFDSLTVNRIYDAPRTLGITPSTVTASVEDPAGNTVSADPVGYGIEITPPIVDMNVRVARASEFCSDVNDVSTCGVIGESRFEGQTRVPRPDSVFGLNPGEKYLVRYVATNFGRGDSPDLLSVAIEDKAQGIVADEPNEDLGIFDSLTVNRIYEAGMQPGFSRVSTQARVTDEAGNPGSDSDSYGVQVSGPAVRLTMRVGPASLFCTDVTDASTCSLQRVKRMQADAKAARQAMAKTAKTGTEREAVLYNLVNEGTLDLVRHTVSDNVTGLVFSDSVFTISSLDSVSVFRIYDDVAQIGDARSSTWTTVSSNGDVIETTSSEEPLPVELVAFKSEVADRDVTLRWTTASEENNAGFEVQQLDETTGTWRALDFIAGAGTTSDAKQYRYAVQALKPNVYRFRLRQVDLDGRFATSQEVEAVIAIDGPYRFTAPSPNPVVSASPFGITTREAQAVRVELYDVLGRRVATLFDGDLDANREKQLQIDGERLASGVYFLRAVGETFSATHQIAVVR